MNSKNHYDDWIYEKLYSALMSAISKSPEVRKVIDELESHQSTSKMAAINLILCLDELSEMTRHHNISTSNQLSVSEDELENFDEVRWMKQARIKF